MPRLSITTLTSILLMAWLFFCGQVSAQDLEPRRWSHLPMGLNVVGIGTGWTDGDIYFDPVLNAKDVTYDLYSGAASYIRTFDFAGKSSRVDILVPYATARWEGLVNGEYTAIRRRGFTDPRLRFSMNLYGAPPLSGKAFMQYKQQHPVVTTIGVAVAVTLPLGDYNDQKLINLGGNRLVVRPQIGVLHQHYKWQFELTGSVFIYQDNDEFWGGNELNQDPLWFGQAHVIYTFKPGWWASLSGGFAQGGRSHVNGVPKSDDSRTRYIALSLGVPINSTQGLKFTYLASDTNISTGQDTGSILAAWSINWGS